jgi:uncharacterized protein
MPDLLDVNVWLALSSADHVHHANARQYWQENADDTRAFCWATAMATLRLFTNETASAGKTLPAREAWQALQRWLGHPGVEMMAEPEHLDEMLGHWAQRLPLRGGDWTDAYLAAFAVVGGYRLVSFDRGFRRFPELDFLLLS